MADAYIPNTLSYKGPARKDMPVSRESLTSLGHKLLSPIVVTCNMQSSIRHESHTPSGVTTFTQFFFFIFSCDKL